MGRTSAKPHPPDLTGPDTDELTSAVVTYIRPGQDKASQHSDRKWGGLMRPHTPIQGAVGSWWLPESWFSSVMWPPGRLTILRRMAHTRAFTTALTGLNGFFLKTWKWQEHVSKGSGGIGGREDCDQNPLCTCMRLSKTTSKNRIL